MRIQRLGRCAARKLGGSLIKLNERALDFLLVRLLRKAGERGSDEQQCGEPCSHRPIITRQCCT